MFVTNVAYIIATADGIDWVNIDYVLLFNTANTADAKQTILQKASEYAMSGPWSQSLLLYS